jgi:ABC-type uncharacterized transport system ATPase subunit
MLTRTVRGHARDVLDLIVDPVVDRSSRTTEVHSVLEVTGLRKSYGEVTALDGASLTTRPGRLLGFLGPNGAGKTTTMRSVFGRTGRGLCDDVVIVAHGRDRLSGTLEEVRAASSYRNVEVRLAGGTPVTSPPGAELIDARGGIVRLRVPVTTDTRAFVAALPRDAAIEHLSFTAPRSAGATAQGSPS